jgi:apolipoprotein D and lipocalin family protein
MREHAHPPPARGRAAAALAVLGLAIGIGIGTAARADSAPLPTVAAVDLARYAGTWHEIAKLPNRFQAHCVADTTATYGLRDDGTVSVINRCRRADGSESAVEGVAWPQDARNATLKVSFLPGVLRWLPIGRGDYQVIALDPDYRWVMVGEPRRAFLWVLARDPRMPAAQLDTLLARARELGFPVERVERTAPPR